MRNAAKALIVRDNHLLVLRCKNTVNEGPDEFFCLSM